MLSSILYNLAFAVFGIFYLPVFLVKIKLADDPDRLWRERWGRLPDSWKVRTEGQRTVWLHAVSVGEVNAVERFVTELLEQDPRLDIVLTTVTPTGQKTAQKLAGRRVRVGYFPFDLTFAVRRCFDTICPEAVLLAETEVWPNLLGEAKRRNIPVGIVNGRLSEKSFGRYRAAGFFLKNIWAGIGFVLAQTEEDAGRFRALGVPREAVREMGNMKFDQVAAEGKDGPSPEELRKRFGFGMTDPVFVAGSTHPGEEEILAEVFRQLKVKSPALKMVIAPRHIERSEDLAGKLASAGCRTALSVPAPVAGSFDVLILNQLGVLKYLYRTADLVFMGGSFIPHGGQNPVEAARFDRAVMHGPHVFNFNLIYRELDRGGGAFLVREPGDLTALSEKFLSDPALRREAGIKANQIVSRLRGASKRQAGWVLTFLAARRGIERTKVDGKSEKLFPAGCGGKMS